MPEKRFPPSVVSAIRTSQILGVRAGTEHRIIGIWAVVVEGRVFVRSWGVKPGGWYFAFVEEPAGVMTVGKRRLRVRAVQTRSERLKDAVSRAYLEKYTTPGSIKYAKEMGKAKSRAATLELVPR